MTVLRRGFRSRLHRLEGAVSRSAPIIPDDWLSEEDWLGRFETWGQQGLFAAEPDFPTADPGGAAAPAAAELEG
jgi:hypothetical protein